MIQEEHQIENNNQGKFFKRVAKPPKVRVIILNNDYSSFDYVIKALRFGFDMDLDTAIKIANEAHQNGEALVCIMFRQGAVLRVRKAQSVESETGVKVEFRLDDLDEVE